MDYFKPTMYGNIKCPKCGRKSYHYVSTFNTWKCYNCRYEHEDDEISQTRNHFRHGERTKEPVKQFTHTIVFDCYFPDGDCKYKSEERLHKCSGCYYAQVIEYRGDGE